MPPGIEGRGERRGPLSAISGLDSSIARLDSWGRFFKFQLLPISYGLPVEFHRSVSPHCCARDVQPRSNPTSTRDFDASTFLLRFSVIDRHSQHDRNDRRRKTKTPPLFQFATSSFGKKVVTIDGGRIEGRKGEKGRVEGVRSYIFCRSR